jgi:hypothetical protein
MPDPLPKPLRCDDVIRALSLSAAPSERESSDLAGHLADCPTCAARWERNASFTRLWEATRPAQPTDSTWDALWARVSHQLDGAADPMVIPMSHRRLRLPRVSVGVMGMARIAAVIAAVVAVSTVPSPISPTRLEAKVDIPDGASVVIHENRAGHRTLVRIDLAEAPTALDDNFVMFNTFEAMATME